MSVTGSLQHAGKIALEKLGMVFSQKHAGDDKLAARQPGAGVELRTIQIESPDFSAGGPIPLKHSALGANESPALTWSGAPQGTVEFVLIVQDPDAPKSEPFTHWLMHRIPGDTAGLSSGVPTERALLTPRNAAQGLNDNGTVGYFGPKPPPGHGVHHYNFQLFALNAPLGLGPDASTPEVIAALPGKVIGLGNLVGTYERTAESK